MPELPEVETIRRDIIKKILNKKIKSIEIRCRKIIKSNYNKFLSILKNSTFKNVERIGKLLIIEINRNFLLIHLKMTGQIVFASKNNLIAGGHSLNSDKKFNGIGGQLPNKHTHIIINFFDGSKTFFNDIRKFGYLKIVDKDELIRIKKNYGIEPLQADFNFKNLKKALQGKTTNIKAFLLNQKMVSGLGNIYVDETLYQARINPTKRAGKLNDSEIKNIIKLANKIIRLAIKYRGTTFNNFIDTEGRKGNFSSRLKVFGKEGETCPNCRRSKIIKKKIAGRGTHFCPNCQV